MKTMDDLRNLFFAALQQETDYLKQRLPSHLFAIINGYLQGGGKRLRPCLFLMCAPAVGGDVEKALPAAVAVEEFHTWTLIHDDVIDHDDFRRGNPTGHILGCRLGKEAWKLSDNAAGAYGVTEEFRVMPVSHGGISNRAAGQHGPAQRVPGVQKGRV